MLDLDSTDRRILRLLQTDASLPVNELAKRVDLSPSPCWRRVKRLKEAGAIRAEVALLDARVLGLDVMAVARVRLTHHSEANVAAFENAVELAPEVLDCLALSGEQDYQLRVIVPDIDSYQAFLARTLLHLPFVAAVNSSFVLKQVKQTTALPIA
jgi:DNA-binding Lrp family transcriptional regulator